MIEWEKYIKWGTFKSTSGIMLKYKWEFDRLNKELFDKYLIIASIISLSHPYNIVDIHTVNPVDLKSKCKAIYYPNTNISEGFVDYKYVLYDDVVTTGKSMLKAIQKYGKKPEKCICIVDRRDEGKRNENYEGMSLNVISVMNKLMDVKK